MPLSSYNQESWFWTFPEQEPYREETSRLVTRRYLSVSEVRRLHQSPGSPVLTEMLAAMQKSFVSWVSEDLGVDEDGFYEVLEQQV